LGDLSSFMLTEAGISQPQSERIPPSVRNHPARSFGMRAFPWRTSVGNGRAGPAPEGNPIMLKLIVRAQDTARRLVSDDEGNAAEYGLIIALIAVVIIGGVTALGLALSGVFNNIAGKI